MLPQQDSRSSYEYVHGSPPDSSMMHSAPRPAPGDALPDHAVQFQSSLDFRQAGAPGFANGNGALSITNAPPPHMPNGGSRHGNTMSLGGFEGSRSPPAAKNTSHVPCKFYRLGQCQAGRACPFSHSTDISSVDTPCKYFAKGNCKFGQKCALAHILPNGRRVNRPSMTGNVMGPRIDPQLYQQSDPVLIQSLLAQQANGVPPPFNHQIPTFIEPEPALQDGGYTGRVYEQIPSREGGSSSRPESKYGSPREDARFVSLSPSARLSVLDAPLPASFDSQGISYMARHGPVAASLPSKIGLLESSPPASLPRKAPIPLDSVSNLGTPGFASRDTRTRGADLGSSPFGSGDEAGFGSRFMHSRRHPKSKLLSTSMPRVDIPIEDSDDDAFHFSGGEEDYIPTSIHDQVFTRDEQQRRYSRTEQDRRLVRDSLSGIGTPNDPSSKVGSPTAGSPSRYGPLFARQQQQDGHPATLAGPAGSTAGNMATSPSAFGHVGSPLRNSSFHMNNAASPTRGHHVSGDLSPSFPSLSSPPRQSSMSVLSQQLSRTRLSTRAAADAASASPSIHPHSQQQHQQQSQQQPLLSPSANSSSHPQQYYLHHHQQAPPNASSTGRSTAADRIEEEHVDGVFSMEDDFDDTVGLQHQHRQRTSGPGPAAPPMAWNQIAAAGAAAAAGKGAGGAGGGGRKAGTIGSKGRGGGPGDMG